MFLVVSGITYLIHYLVFRDVHHIFIYMVGDLAPNSAVTAMQPPSARAGLEMLKNGGNAIDAAVAMGFCNVVLEPYMATIGGMGYMFIHLAREGKTVAIDFNGRAPRKAHPEMYRVIGPAPAGSTQVFSIEDVATNFCEGLATNPSNISYEEVCDAGFDV